MSYTDYQSVINRYPTVATWNSSATIVNSDLIYFAERQINSLLGTHFSVPFSAAHPTIADLAIDMAYYRAVRFKDVQMAKRVQDDVMGRIENIKAGKEFIYTGSGTTIAPMGLEQGVWSSNEEYHPVHSMLDPLDEFVDDDRLDDEVDERD